MFRNVLLITLIRNPIFQTRDSKFTLQSRLQSVWNKR